MNTIKFSHKYKKHENINLEDQCRLLEIFIKDHRDMHAAFIEYDTAFADSYKNYNLKPGRYIVLLFIDSEGTPFTTVRPHTTEKERYYSHKRGTYFNIEVKGKILSKEQKGIGEWAK